MNTIGGIKSFLLALYAAFILVGTPAYSLGCSSQATLIHEDSDNVVADKVSWETKVSVLDRFYRFLTAQRILQELGVDQSNATVHSRQVQTVFNESWNRMFTSQEEDDHITISTSSPSTQYSLSTAGVRIDGSDPAPSTNGLHLVHYQFAVRKPNKIGSYSTVIGAKLELTGLAKHETCRPFLNGSIWQIGNATWNTLDASQDQLTTCGCSANVTELISDFWATHQGNKELLIKVGISNVKEHSPRRSGHQQRHHRMTPILKIQLQSHETSKRQIRNLPLSFPWKTATANGTDNQQQQQQRIRNRIMDCDQQWDPEMMASTPADVYDSLMPCCRRQLRISFKELGWDDWVFAPKHFDTYYCTGRCSLFEGLAAEDMQGSTFYAELMNLYRKSESVGMSPCCTPIKFAPLTVAIWQGSNEQVTQTLDGIIVKQCGCM